MVVHGANPAGSLDIQLPGDSGDVTTDRSTMDQSTSIAVPLKTVLVNLNQSPHANSP